MELTTRVESDAGDAQLQDLHEHIVGRSQGGNPDERPIKLRMRLVKT